MIILDTHIWVRWLDPKANPLSRSLINKIESADMLAVSSVSCWEIAWLYKRGRLSLTLPLNIWMDQALQGSGINCLPIDRRIALRAAEIAEHHRDPADRLIIATAIEYQAQLISLDEYFSKYDELSELLIRN